MTGCYCLFEKRRRGALWEEERRGRVRAQMPLHPLAYIPALYRRRKNLLFFLGEIRYGTASARCLLKRFGREAICCGGRGNGARAGASSRGEEKGRPPLSLARGKRRAGASALSLAREGTLFF